jgi:putative oxidoreductase
MKIAMIIVRTLMGLLLIAAAVVVLLNLVPKPEMTGAVKTFNEGMDAAPYFITVIKLTELFCGIAFLIGRFVPLATVVIAPVIVQIFLFHLFMDRSGMPVAIFLVLANIFVAYYYRRSYAGLLTAKPAISG